MRFDLPHPQGRLGDLLVDRATGGLDRTEAIELEGLLAIHPGQDDESFDLLAATLDVALDGHEEPLPASLADRLSGDAELFWTHRNASGTPASSRPERRSPAPRPRRSRVLVGWVVAAAVALAAWLGWTQRPAVPEPRELREHVLVDASDLKQWQWQGLEDPTVGDVSGEVVWSDALQEGAMRIGGLAANDPRRFQYQLWIFDRARDERYPVDGGVFDVPEEAGEVIVPIRAKLRVEDAYLFAVTVEEPGGVVVSSRARLAILAQPPAEG